MKTLFENAKTQFKKLMHVAKFTPVIKFNGPKKAMKTFFENAKTQF